MTSSFMIPGLREIGAGFLHLLYPDLCVGCQHDLPLQDTCFCLRCQLKNEVFDLASPGENVFTRRMWGRLPLHCGLAAYHFTRKSPVQKALHQLKYRNKPDIALLIGRAFAKRLVASNLSGFDAIVPVPLHPRKERQRGYNQSAVFARGLSEILGIPVWDKVLQRTAFTSTQTRKKRMERFENVGAVFTLRQPELIRGKHLLLVDDVLTTGATVEMCGQALLQAPQVQLSLATIAIADI